jgi:sporulation-control protein
MFKKILASVGIGAAKVDTILETEHLQPGQLFNANIVITAGDVAQEIAGLDLFLMTRVKVDGEEGEYFTNHVIDQWRITDIGTVEPGEVKSIPFEARLHPETPITGINAGYNQSHVMDIFSPPIQLSVLFNEWVSMNKFLSYVCVGGEEMGDEGRNPRRKIYS